MKAHADHHITTDLPQVRKEASEWLFRLTDQPVSEEDRAAFTAWLTADDQHDKVFRRLHETWTGLSHMPEPEDMEVLLAPGPLERLRRWGHQLAYRLMVLRGRWRVVSVLGTAVAASLAMVVVLSMGAPVLNVGPAPPYVTEIAEIRTISLSDGSTVTLGAASGIDVRFTETARHVVLSEGEAFFDVAKDPDRPFFVAAGETVVRVVGTKFDVHHGKEQVRVSVLEGVVEVSSSPDIAKTLPAPITRLLTEGQQAISKKQGRISLAFPIAQDEVAGWRSGRFSYVDAPLKDIIADMNRYHDGKITIADSTIAEIGFTASFRVDQIEEMVEMIAVSLSLQVSQDEDGRVVIIR